MREKKSPASNEVMLALLLQRRTNDFALYRLQGACFLIKKILKLIVNPRKELHRRKVRKIIFQEGLFNEKFYIINNIDLIAECFDPYNHFFAYGWKEKRNPSAIFDTSYYLEHNKDVAQSGVNPLEHYVLSGRSEGRSKNRIEQDIKDIRAAELLDDDWYLSEYAELKKFEIEPCRHFCKFGWKEGKMPNPFFETDWYVQKIKKHTIEGLSEQGKDKEYLTENPVIHWLKKGRELNFATHSGSKEFLQFILPRLRYSDIYKLIKNSGLFDEEYYQEQLENSVADPLDHYISIGYYKNISPNILFDNNFYLSQVEELKSYDIPPLIHYILRGSRFGIKPSPYFDPAFYRKYYSSICALMDPLVHFINYGWQEWRRPSADFHTPAHVLAYFQSPPEKEAFFSSLKKYHHPVMKANAYENYQAWYEREKPEVSIILLNWNKTFLTEDCLLSLWQYTAGYRYEIIVVDNGSETEEKNNLLKFAKEITVLPLKVNRYFGEGNNIGVEQARGEYLVILNNDTIATGNWLSPLISELKDNPDAGAVGSQLMFPNGLIQEAGARITSEGEVTQLQKGLSDNGSLQICEVDYCSGAALAMKKDTFIRVLGFDYTWEPAYYEDSDLCLKIRTLGKKILNVPESRIIHLEHISVSNQTSLDFNRIIEVNKRKFQQRWASYLKYGEIPCVALRSEKVDKFFLCREKNKNAFVYTPCPLLLGGGERYLLTIIEELLQDFQVYLVCEEKYSSLRVHSLADDLGLYLPGIKVISEREMHELEVDVELSVVMGNEILPRIPAMGRKNIFHCQFPFKYYLREYGITRSMVENYDGYDRIMVNSEFTRQNILQQQKEYCLKNIKVEVINPPVEGVVKYKVPSNLKKHRILTIGRFFAGGHNKKHDFMIKAFQQLKRRCGDEDIEFHLVGGTHSENVHKKYLDKLMRMAEGFPIFFHLDASNSTLEQLLLDCTIYWHATGIDVDPRYYPEAMEHFGISVVEAMKNGCIPLVPNKGGVVEIVKGCSQKRLCYRNMIELVDFTDALLHASPEEISIIKKDVLKRAKCYGNDIFKRETRKMIDSIEYSTEHPLSLAFQGRTLSSR
jgi:GT2 family glycosyltransferase